jgi:hypothetical protein
MQGLWSFDLVFCDSINAVMGDLTIQPVAGLFGYSHGSRVKFDALNKTIRMTPINKPIPTPTSVTSNAEDDLVEDVAPTPENPHIHDNVKEFVMYYDNGDIGAPCSSQSPRAAEVHIWCSYQAKNCNGIPGAADNSVPFSGNLTNGYALCGIFFNQTIGVCRGLQLHLLSNSCPSGSIVKKVIGGGGVPTIAPSNSAMIALVICSVILLVLIVLFFSCWGYRASVLGRKGITAMPGYDIVAENRNRRFSKIEDDNKVGIAVSSSSGGEKSSYGAI